MYGRGRDVSLRIDADNALDRVDGRNAVCAAAFGGFRCGAHLRHIRRELSQDRKLRAAPCRCGKALDQLRHLPDIRSETAVRHVGTGKVQFDRIRAVFFAQARKLRPFLIILTHDGCQDEFVRIVLLQPAEDLHILRHAVVGELFDILKPDDASVVPRDSRKPGRSLVDREGADRLERSASPARFKGSGAHVICAGYHRGRQQEGILQREPEQIGPQTVFVFRQGDRKLRLHLIVDPRQQAADRYLMRPDAGVLAGSRAGRTGIDRRKACCCRFFGIKPQAAQDAGRVKLAAGSRARSILT